MNSTTSHTFPQLVAVFAAAGLFMACADRAPIGPDARSASSSSTNLLTPAEVQAASDGRFPDLGDCSQLRIDDGSRVSFHVFGIGVQIYHWNGTSWVFFNPEANLYADAGGIGLVGTHFGGPTNLPNWKTLSGSQVEGTVAERCTPNANAIAWVKLTAVAQGSGVFEHTNFIQRLNTVGGLAPTAPGTVVGQEARSPYTADYYFYTAP
jgi:hypothetical protein